MDPIPAPSLAIFGAVLGGLSLARAVGGSAIGRTAISTVGRGLRAIAGTPARRVALSAGGGVVAGDVISASSGLRTVTSASTPVVASSPVFTGPVMTDQPMVPKSASGRAMAAQAGELPLTLPVQYTAVARPPRGYVTVMYNGAKLFMLKGCAKDLGLWSPEPKPPISPSDWRNLRRARTTARKAARVGDAAEEFLGGSRRYRSSSSSSSSKKGKGGRRRGPDGRFL